MAARLAERLGQVGQSLRCSLRPPRLAGSSSAVVRLVAKPHQPPPEYGFSHRSCAPARAAFKGMRGQNRFEWWRGGRLCGVRE